MLFSPVSMNRATVPPFKAATRPAVRFGHEGHEPEKPTAPASKKKPGLLRNPLGLLILGLLGIGIADQGYRALKPAAETTAESCQASGGTFVTRSKTKEDGTQSRTTECVPAGQPIVIGSGESVGITVPLSPEVREAIKNLVPPQEKE